MRRSRAWLVLIIGLGLAAAWIAWRSAQTPPTRPHADVALVGPHEGRVSAIVVDARQPTATGDVHGRIVLWRDAPDSWVAHDGPVRALAWHGDRLLSVGGDGSAALWDADGRVQWRRRHPEALNDGALIGEALIVATIRGTVARLGPDGPIWQSRGAHGQVAFAVSPGTQSVFSAGDDGRIVERGVEQGEVRREWRASVHWIGALRRGPTGLVFADGAGHLGRQTPDGFTTRPAITGPGVALAVDGVRTAVGGDGGEIDLVDAGARRTLKTGDSVLSLAFKGDTLLSGGDSNGAVRIWRVKDGVEVGRLPPDPSPKEPR